MPVNLPGFEELLLLDCLAQTQQPMRGGKKILFLKTQEAGIRGESGGGGGSENSNTAQQPNRADTSRSLTQDCTEQAFT